MGEKPIGVAVITGSGDSEKSFQWIRTFFAFTLIIEGTAENVLQLIMSLQSIYNRNFGFTDQKMYF